MIESLESRRLLAASLDGGVLTVTGTELNDRISIGVRGTQVVVLDGRTFFRFDAAAVDRVVVDALGGGDSVSLSDTLTKPATVNGGAGNDRLRGGGGTDTLNGGEGNDALDGGAGDDNLDGGAGDDRLGGGVSGADALTGGDGRDGADYSRRIAAVNVSLDGQANDGAEGEGDNVAADVEAVHGGSGDDTLTGSDGANVLSGGDGNDTLNGGGGADALNGGAGNDTVNGDGGDDRLGGGDGDDTVSGGDGNDWLVGGLGADRLLGGAGNDRIVALDGVIDTVDGGEGTDGAQTDADDVVSNVEMRRTPGSVSPTTPRVRPTPTPTPTTTRR